MELVNTKDPIENGILMINWLKWCHKPKINSDLLSHELILQIK